MPREFSIDKSGVYEHMQVIRTLEPILVQKAILFPKGREARQVLVDFEELCGLPQCAGAIDGCLIPMRCPPGPWNFRYHCYKGFDAMLLLAVVDARGYFTYIRSGFPGCTGDASAWGDCPLKGKLETGTFFPPECARSIGGVVVAPFLVGDAAFPFRHYMMKCYNGNHEENTPEGCFNYALIRTRRVVENAFGRLKGRFRVLMAGRISDDNLAPKLINLCCALHNIAQRCNDPFEDSLFVEPEHPAREYDMSDGAARVGRPSQAMAASVIRDAIRDYLAS